MEVLDIVVEYLQKNNYDGLVNSNYECGCVIDDIAPCGEINGDCVSGYKQMCTSECDHEGYDPNILDMWHIQREKPQEE